MKKVALILALVALVGCERNKIKGRVLDVQGETLPGVAVHVEGTEFQALTNPLGEYSVEYQPGALALNFIKSGFTPGRLELKVDALKGVDAADVLLWRLPEGWGVYLVEDARYNSVNPIAPDVFTTVSDTLVYGVKKGPEVSTTNATPMIVCYKLPRNEVRFCRMASMEIEVRPPDVKGAVDKSKGQKVTVWTVKEKLPVTVTRIDEPEGLLQQIQFTGPLAPGCYAVHWGALEGHTELDKRIFYFNVVDPNAPPPPPPGPPEKAGDKDKKKAATETPKKPAVEEPPVNDSSGF
jgi:hypothetical protein